MIRSARHVVATCLLIATAFGMSAMADLSTGVVAKDLPSASSENEFEIEKVDTRDFPTVRIVIKVPGGFESVLAGGGAFSITENDRPQPTTATNILSGDDLEVILVIDRSGSMTIAALEATKKAAIGFITSLPPEVSIGLVSFGTNVTLDVGLTKDRDRLAAAVSAIKAEGRTALNNAVVFASTLFAPTTERRVMVLLSDGGDSASSATLEEAVASTRGIRVEIIELITADTNRNALDQLAAPQLVRSTPNPAELDELYESVAQSLIGRVEITYASKAQVGDKVDLDISLIGSDGTRRTAVSFNAIPSSVPPAIKTPAQGSTPLVAENSERSAGSSTWFLISSIAIIFFGLVLLLVSLFVPPDRTMRQRLYPSSARIEDRTTAENIATTIEHRLKNSRRYKLLVADVETSGIGRTPSVFVLHTVLITVVSVIAGYAIIGIPGGLIAMFLVPIGSLKLLRRKISRRRIDFVAQLPDTLQMLGSMLRSGYGLVQALDTVANEADEPTRGLLGKVMLEVRTGRDPIESLRVLAVQIDSLDVDWLVAGIEISRDVGSDLVSTLDTVAETVRERESLRGQISALTAEGRLSAYVMLVLPPIVGVMSFVVNRDFAGVLFEGVGLWLLAATGFLMSIGYIWMRSIISKVS